MALQPFIWGNGGQINTPDAAERQRRIAEALMPRQVASNPWEGLSQVAGAFTASHLNNRASAAEEAGQVSAAEALSRLSGGGTQADIIAALSNPWLSQPQASVASALLGQQMERSDPAYQLDLELKRAQLEAARAPAQPDYPASVEEYLFAQSNPAYADWMKENSGPETVINNTLGSTNKFQETMDAKAAETFNTLIDTGSQAQVAAAKINQLDGLLSNAPQGMQGGLVSMAASVGLPVEGADEVQAAEALINQLVPQQRPAGSGTMSDADLELFKKSLPRIINQPGGNKLIIDTMKAINEYTIKQGEIANMVATGQLNPAEGRAALYALPNPLENMPKASETTSKPTQTNDGVVEWTDYFNGN